MCAVGARGALRRFAWGVLALAVAACGGQADRVGATSSGGKSSSSAGGAPNAGGGGVLGVGGGCYDGGQVPITATQRDAILASGCAAVRQEVPQTLELVVDVSESMNEPAPESPGRSKWEVTRDVLLELVVRAEGPGLPEFVAVGLVLFPNLPTSEGSAPREVSACVDTAARVPIARLGPAGSAQRQLLEAALRNVQPRGATPMQDAHRYAQTELAGSVGRSTLLLVTDGSATLAAECLGTGDELSPIEPELMVEEVLRAASSGLKTFVLGASGSEANQQWLSMAARRGGTARPGCSESEGSCHFDLSSAPSLGAELTEWGSVGIVPGCDDISPAELDRPIDSASISVLLTRGGQTTLLNRDCGGECTQGWQLNSDFSVRLCSDTCGALWPFVDTVVEVVYGCR